MFKAVLKFPVIKVTTEWEVHKAYELARISKISTMIIEIQKLYYND